MLRLFRHALSIVLFVSFSLAHAGNLRVLTLNVFAGKQEMDFERLRRQLEAVKSLDPDIIAL